MAQHDYDIANQSFPSFRSDLNSVLEAINTSNSGTSRPSSAVAGTIWLDSTNATSPTLKFFDGSDDISLATLDYTANTVNWLDSTVVFDIVGDTTPQLGGDLDVNGNSIVSVSNGNITFTPDGTGKVIIDGLSFPTADGTTGQFLKTDGSGNLSFDDVGGGITGADQWRITADHSGVGDVTANWERADSDGFSYIGTGMSESSGIFTFPETGIWSIQFISMPTILFTYTNYLLSTIETTVDNSTYDTASRSYVRIGEAGGYENANCYFIFDVTNTTTHKCKFKLAQNQAGTPKFQGNTGHNSTFATFIRLGDT